MIDYLHKIALNLLPTSWLRIPSVSCDENAVLSELPKLIIDVSSIAQSDAKTGIQRVVRNLYQQLLLAPPSGYQIYPVMATRRQFYQRVATDFLQHASPAIADTAPIQIHVGDIFLGLDLSAHLIPHHLPALRKWKRQGLRMSFVIYDLLPIFHPHWFNARVSKNFKKWLRALAILADNTVAISRSVQGDFYAWTYDTCKLGKTDLPCTVIQLGAELDADDSAHIDAPTNLPAHLVEQKFVLMVGTIEPRKGHEDVLDAFEQLWNRGESSCLVIVGKQGWKVERFINRMQSHVEAGKRLHWLANANDNMLRSLYQRCQGVIVASKGEGFGLPLIEAAYFNKPVLARDITVFREISGPHVSFFPDQETDSLSHFLSAWLDKLNTECYTLNNTVWMTWQESYTQLIQILVQSPDQETISAQSIFCDVHNEPSLNEGAV